MRVFMRFVLFFLIPLILVGCDSSMSEGKGSLVVSNYSESENIYITHVYVREQDSSGYQLVWSGELPCQSTEFIMLEPGRYSVGITVSFSVGIVEYIKPCDTGYNIYRELEEDGFLNVIFDGKGIYFE